MLILISYVAIALLLLVSVFYIVLKLSRFKTFARNSFFFVGIYLLSFTAWFLLELAVDKSQEWFISLPDSLLRAMKGMALGNSEAYSQEVFDAAGHSKLYIPTQIIMIYIGQGASFAFTSTAVIHGLFKIAVAKRDNYKVNRNFIKDKDARGAYSTNVLFTDLEFNDIKPFLENMKKNPRTKIKVVVPNYHYATQNGQELVEILKLNRIDVYTEAVNKNVVWKFAFFKFPGYRNVNFYSMLYHDIDNLNFAKIANDFLSTTKLGRYKNDNKTVNIYIAYQDEEFAMNFEYEKISKGAIQLVNEYDWIASKFVYENPITRFIDVNKNNFAEQLKNNPDLHVHFFGFGNINKAILKRMFPNYQLPYDDRQVHYHILDRSAGSDHYDKSFLARYQALNELYKQKGFYPQYDFEKYFDAIDVDLENDEELHEYIEKLVKYIKDKKEDERKNVTNLIFISLGDMQLSVQVANKVRTFVRNISSAYGDVLKENELTKSFIIYPYIKDNNFFRKSYSIENQIYKEVIAMNNPNIEECVDKLYNDSKKDYGKEFNGSLLYVFENKYRKEQPAGGQKKGLDELQKKNVIVSRIRKEQFKLEKCPVVVFGRGGYISDPLRGMIYKIAKHANNNYSSVYSESSIQKRKDEYRKLDRKGKDKFIFDKIDNKWFNTNYPKKQTNLGLALTFQTKLNLIGYELKWDKDDVTGKYAKIKNESDKKAFYEKNKERYRGYFDEPVDNLLAEYGYDESKTTLEDVDLSHIYDRLSSSLQKRINKNDMSLDKVKKAFEEEYKSSYEKYLSGDDKQDDKVYEMVKDYFYITYLSTINSSLDALARMEHNRWYVESARYGIVPRLANDNNIDYKMTTKSKDETANLCMTTVEGLDLYAFDTLKKMVNERKIFAEEIDYNIANEGLKEFDAFCFDRGDKNHAIFNHIYKIIFEYDLMAYQNTKKLHEIEMENKDNNYRFIIRNKA